MPLPTASDGISREQFKRGSWNLIRLSCFFPEMTSLAVLLGCKNVVKCCTKCVELVRLVKVLNNSANVWPRITKFRTAIHADLIHSHTGYDVTSYLWSAFMKVRKNGRKCRLQRFKRWSRNFTHLVWKSQPHKLCGYDVTNCFRPAVKYNKVLHKSV